MVSVAANLAGGRVHKAPPLDGAGPLWVKQAGKCRCARRQDGVFVASGIKTLKLSSV